jgi:transcriptional regulator GlxA family with amidase domain
VLLRLDRDLDVAQAVVRLAAASDQISAWRLHWLTLARHVQAAPQTRVPRAAHPAVGLVIDLIERRYQEPGLCLKTAGDSVRCSASHLGQLLRRQTGLGFTAHLRRCRVRAAQQLLCESTLPLKAIAAECGFATPCQFSRQFAHAVGTTPTGFRARAKRQDASEMTSERACDGAHAVHNR